MQNVAITGIGVISPLGQDVERHSRRLLAGEVAFQPSPWKGAGEAGPAFWAPVLDFEASDWMNATVIDGTDVFARWTVAAAVQAVADSGLETLDELRTAIVHGTSMGGTRALLEAQHLFETQGPTAVPRKTSIKIWPNMAAAQVAMHFKLHGTQITITTACASSIDAIGTAARLIADGRADYAITGGTEGGSIDPDAPPEFIPATFYSGTAYGMTSAEPDILRSSMPFDANRTGIVTGEGSAILFLEREDLARQRGARIYGRVRGYGNTADGTHPSSPEPSGRWEEQAMRLALQDAGLEDGRTVDAVVAHATGTPKGDTPEIRALNHLFGGRGLPVTSLKGTIGHTGASAGCMGVIAGLHAMHAGSLPPTMGTTDPDPEIDFDVIMGQAREVDVATVQVNAFGFGGQDASLVVTKD
jgi:3-oxoacyl-[acyl-carrier-protein] synthase II